MPYLMEYSLGKVEFDARFSLTFFGAQITPQPDALSNLFWFGLEFCWQFIHFDHWTPLASALR